MGEFAYDHCYFIHNILMPLWQLMRFYHFVKALMPLVAFDDFGHPLDGCMDGAWLGSSLCVGLPGWRLGRLTMMSLS